VRRTGCHWKCVLTPPLVPYIFCDQDDTADFQLGSNAEAAEKLHKWKLSAWTSLSQQVTIAKSPSSSQPNGKCLWLQIADIFVCTLCFFSFKVSSIAAQAGKEQLHNAEAYTSFAQQNASCVCNLWANRLIYLTFGELSAKITNG
jgi:hypothetical protein